MGDKTSIEWTDATWNPIRGAKGNWSCVKISEGCAHCYAERLNVRFGGPPYVVGADQLRLDETILTQPLRWRRPRRIFVCSMTDLFEERVPDEWIARIFGVMCSARQHQFQVLTKRSERLAAWVSRCANGGGLGWMTHDGTEPERAYRGTGIIVGTEDRWPLPNVWLGVSVENQARADERIPWLLKTPAAVRFLSVEPLLGPVDIQKALGPQRMFLARDGTHVEHGVNWVIVGGESGGPPERALVVQICICGDWREDHKDGRGRCQMPNDMTHGFRSCRAFRPFGLELKDDGLRWVRSLRDQCEAAGVPFFFKQWGGPTPKSGGRLLDGKEWNQWPT